MSRINIDGIESVRFSAPDLPQMREFLIEFGLLDAGDCADGVLRMRGTGDAPYLHETVEGAPGFQALSVRAANIGELERLAKAEGVPLQDIAAPGGGAMVQLRDPNGFLIEVVAGKAPASPIPDGVAGWNTLAQKQRSDAPKRLSAGPARVARLGHVVLGVNDTQETWDWWRSRFALVMSDEVRAPNGALAAAFIRLDQGDVPTDHHSLNFAAIPGKPPVFHHAAFEVLDLDDLMVGHEHLRQAGRKHDWGIGRHILGSQVFDYWKDPWGHRLEHWTDGDVFTAEAPTSVHDLSVLMGQQWGPDAPADFV
ncbi:VOC family protein [Novosphingobium sp. BL-8H]|uniref:VOC family protein n=1 Tax=Novosphingobium sp. BL-8H TaxID=3127640 RepID=UPI0037562F4F